MEELHAKFADDQSDRFKRRFQIVFVLILLALITVGVRLFYLQILKGEEFRHKSENNSIRLRKIKPPRGLIMDRNREVMVENQPSFDILFAPNRLGDIGKVSRRLNSLYAERDLYFSHELTLAENARPYAPVRLDRNAKREKVAIVEANALDLPGVFVEVTPVRKYHHSESIAHVVGYTGEITEKELEKNGFADYSVGDIVGKYGVEKYLDQYLRGKNGAEQIEVNALGKKVKVLGMISPSSGYNAILNIDSILQKTAWDALQGRPGSVVAMNVKDGSVLALVSSPSFDANVFSGGITVAAWERLSNDSGHPMENRAIAGQYPPGSTYKLFVAAAALEEGLITPDKTFFCNGAFTFGNRTYRCWREHGHGVVDLHRAIVESCDVYFYNVGKAVGVDKIASYARQFGLGTPTGVDLPREKNGLIPTKEWKLSRTGEPWQPGETISISIGQGFNLVTPLQLVSAYSALANGGTVFRPRIIKGLETADGMNFKEFGPEVKNKLTISKKNMDLLAYALWGVVNEKGGTGSALKRAEEDVCGKTGTAQVIGSFDAARPGGRIAQRYRDHALFVGFAPYKDPEVAVAVIVENAGHGGSVAAPVARKVIDAYFSGRGT